MRIRPIQPTDYKKVEQLIRDAILEVNRKDYSQQVIDFMVTVDPYKPRDTSQERDYFVATDENNIYGVIGLKNNEVKTFFVDPHYHGRGVGKALLSYIESIMIEASYEVSCVYSSISAKNFYKKYEYKVVREDSSRAGEGTMLRYYMEKNLKR